MPTTILNISMSSNFIFAYQINPEAINLDALPKQMLFDFSAIVEKEHKATSLFDKIDDEETKEDVEMTADA
jgi:hypothetical protein